MDLSEVLLVGKTPHISRFRHFFGQAGTPEESNVCSLDGRPAACQFGMRIGVVKVKTH
ncbi:MAG: hypothetical protein SF052_11555 [Bacteroidia bacterium]|nr:hypothetical protein [Bacteroidia bacterium]